jgi:hypothetical protein
MLAQEEKSKEIHIVQLDKVQWDYLNSIKKDRGGSVASALRELVEESQKHDLRKARRAAAEVMAAEYSGNPELTIMTSLDDEPFL